LHKSINFKGSEERKQDEETGLIYLNQKEQTIYDFTLTPIFSVKLHLFSVNPFLSTVSDHLFSVIIHHLTIGDIKLITILMTFVVIPDFVNYLFFSLIVHIPEKFIIKTHGTRFETHIVQPVKKPLFRLFQVFAIDVERIGLPV
jgi:hypothetical protein